jgi:hypothetical protein
MSSRNPDTSSAVMVALFSATMLISLFGALALPPSASWYKWLGMALAGLIVGLPFFLRAAHRSRIRHAVQETGGNVIRIWRLPFWKQDSLLGRDRMILHEVRYVDSAGVEREAVCRSGFLHGVEWITNRIVDSRLPHV